MLNKIIVNIFLHFIQNKNVQRMHPLEDSCFLCKDKNSTLWLLFPIQIVYECNKIIVKVNCMKGTNYCIGLALNRWPCQGKGRRR